MNILMATNTYLPHVGGVARSVATFTELYRKEGHNVLVLAPRFEGCPDEEPGVVRVPAIQNFNGSDFSVRLPIPPGLFPTLEEFKPDVVHSHHPFLLGDTALRIAAEWQVPTVFTHHTMYERYIHYVPGDAKSLKKIAMKVATEYSNLCQQVIAPSESIRDILLTRGVHTPITVVPTGVDTAAYSRGDGDSVRAEIGLSKEDFIIGHVGRLAPEKNLKFLASAVAQAMKELPTAHFVVVGEGPSEPEIREVFDRAKLESRLHMIGSRTGQKLIDSYRCLDLFVFASQTETQGMVLAEAMAAGLPVIAVDAPGAREVVQTNLNGTLLSRENASSFAKAIVKHAKLPIQKRSELKHNAARTAANFDSALCAHKALEVYAAAQRRAGPMPQLDGSSWDGMLNRFAVEWDLLKGRARAFGIPRLLWRFQPWMIAATFRGKAKRLLSRAEWAARLLRLSREKEWTDDPGLVLIQIDGLARAELKRALDRGRTPFLRKLIRRGDYGLFSFYSGIPSTTPAVQAELFYGKKQAVPAFAFRDRQSKSQGESLMFNPDVAKGVEEELKQSAEGLLRGGACYSDIYTGEAAEPHFCPAAIGWHLAKEALNPWRWLVLLALYFPTLIRMIALIALELVLALGDIISGVLKGEKLGLELKFVTARIAISIGLRELITTGAVIDVTRGLPIIHLNYLGYDEHAHRRGPSSFFAHWTLKGIDRQIQRIYRAAHRSPARNYQVWVYSDHGQETAQSYEIIHGKTIRDAVVSLVETDKVLAPAAKAKRRSESEAIERARWLGGKRLQKLFPAPWSSPKPEPSEDEPPHDEVFVEAMGPIGHVYLPDSVAAEKKAEVAMRLVKQCHVPMACVVDSAGKITAYTKDATYTLPNDAPALLDDSVPYYHELVDDFCALTKHPNAGDIVFAGWLKGKPPLSFPAENGAHAGPGPNETHAFACLPEMYRKEFERKGYLRPLELRALAMRHLGRQVTVEQSVAEPVEIASKTLRVMSYNVHSCLGMDNRRSTVRIAEVIAHYEADVVCLQELDVYRPRSGSRDQVEEIARELEMHFYFCPALRIEEEKYGDAILSKYPIQLVKSGGIPSLAGRPDLEPRGAIWTELQTVNFRAQILNTHLGLLRQEREIQTYDLLGKNWLDDPRCKGPVIFAGDFNALPGSYVYKMLTKRLKDVSASVKNYKAEPTWLSIYPIRRLDYIFCTPDLKIKQVLVPRTKLTRVASDHLPLIVDLEWD